MNAPTLADQAAREAAATLAWDRANRKTMPTPGPWKQWRGADGSVNIVNGDNDYVCLVGVRGGDAADERIESDAALIEQAPNMLKAIRRVLDDCGKFGWEISTECEDELERIVASMPEART